MSQLHRPPVAGDGRVGQSFWNIPVTPECSCLVLSLETMNQVKSDEHLLLNTMEQ